MTNKNNAKKKTSNKVKENNKKVSYPKNEIKRNNQTEEVNENRKEEVIAKKIEEVPTKKEKKSFSLTSKQKDIILILLVAVLLVVALVLTSHKEPKLDIELPVVLEGETGFTEITYDQYEEKVNNKDMFLVVIVRDGCGYCEAYEPIVEKVANDYNLPFYYINLSNLTSEESNKLISTNKYLKRQKKWGTPTTLFMYGDNIVDSIGGYVEEETFVDFVKENFKVEK